MLKKYKNKLKEEGEVYLLCRIFAESDESIIKEIKTNDVAGKKIEMLIIKVKSSPVKGKANKEILKLLAEAFSISVFNIKIITGSSHRSKLIKIKK